MVSLLETLWLETFWPETFWPGFRLNISHLEKLRNVIRTSKYFDMFSISSSRCHKYFPVAKSDHFHSDETALTRRKSNENAILLFLQSNMALSTVHFTLASLQISQYIWRNILSFAIQILYFHGIKYNRYFVYWYIILHVFLWNKQADHFFLRTSYF